MPLPTLLQGVKINGFVFTRVLLTALEVKLKQPNLFKQYTQGLRQAHAVKPPETIGHTLINDVNTSANKTTIPAVIQRWDYGQLPGEGHRYEAVLSTSSQNDITHTLYAIYHGQKPHDN